MPCNDVPRFMAAYDIRTRTPAFGRTSYGECGEIAQTEIT